MDTEAADSEVLYDCRSDVSFGFTDLGLKILKHNDIGACVGSVDSVLKAQALYLYFLSETTDSSGDRDSLKLRKTLCPTGGAETALDGVFSA